MGCISKLFILVLQSYCLAELANYNRIQIEKPVIVNLYNRTLYYDYDRQIPNEDFNTILYNTKYYDEENLKEDRYRYNRTWYYDSEIPKVDHRYLYNRTWYYDNEIPKVDHRYLYNRTLYYDRENPKEDRYFYNRKYYDKKRPKVDHRYSYNRSLYYDKGRQSKVDRYLYNRSLYYDKGRASKSLYYDRKKPTKLDRYRYNRSLYYDRDRPSKTDRYRYNRTYDRGYRRNLRNRPFAIDDLVFPILYNYQAYATPAKEANYPWIGKVVHSPSGDYPFVCTASLIEKGIFITAARCINSLKIINTRVIYKKKRLPVKVFVVPSPQTTQQFDDVGIIIVVQVDGFRDWTTVKYHSSKRTDSKFNWFEKLQTIKDKNYKVIGHAQDKDVAINSLPPKAPETLYELPVTVGIKLCHQIFTNNKIQGYEVPCYVGCNYKQFIAKNPLCEKFIGTYGAAVYNTKTKTLLGVATWGVLSGNRELPVGFSVPNSDNFVKDLACARKINNDKNANPPKGYFQKLCG